MKKNNLSEKKNMFENKKRFELGKITSIPIDYGIEYILSVQNNQPEFIPIERNKMKFNQLKGVALVDYKVLSNRLIKGTKTLDILGNLDLDVLYDIELPKTFSNLFMDKIDKLKIGINQPFSLVKIENDNGTYDLEIKKKS